MNHGRIGATALREKTRQLLMAKWVWPALLAGYAIVVLTILAPVLFSSIGADDRYWILEAGPRSAGSAWALFWEPLIHAFDFDGQARTTALTTAERRVVSLIAMETATLWAIPPAVTWSAVKVALLALAVVAVVAFLRQLRYRGRHGDILMLQPQTIAFIAIALPLTIALGAKSQNFASLNGWIHYPTITYGPFVVYLLVSAAALKASALLQTNYRRRVIPIAAILATLALLINLSYEFLALSIPLSALVLALQPVPQVGSRSERWRGKVTVFLALAGTYTVIFLWIRWKISQMSCNLDGSCYTGNVVEFDPRTLFYNFVGALPGGTGAFVVESATKAGRSLPEVNASSITIAVLGVMLLVALWSSWNARRDLRIIGSVPTSKHEAGEARGLIVVIAVGLLIALGSAAITGISARAVELLQSPMLPYRNGVVTWSGLALAGIAAVRLLTLSRWPLLRYTAVVAFLAVLVGGISLYLPRNIESALANRASIGTQLNDALHWELALGDESTAGDERRCDSLEEYAATYGPVSSAIRTLEAADSAYRFYHGRPYCSAGIPTAD